MTDKPGKYAAALAAISQPKETRKHIALPMKPEPPRGKRSTAGWKQKAVLLKETSIEEASVRV
jgi:hypothetical protein